MASSSSLWRIRRNPFGTDDLKRYAIVADVPLGMSYFLSWTDCAHLHYEPASPILVAARRFISARGAPRGHVNRAWPRREILFGVPPDARHGQETRLGSLRASHSVDLPARRNARARGTKALLL
jgi:hypothetical protein